MEIDGVEIDPKVTEVGRRYFGLGDNPRLHVITADGRPYLAGTDKRYDIIAVDAYHQPYIPFYLATEEFFRLVRDHLAPGGAVALNVAAVPGDERLSDALGTTMLTEFPSVWRWRALEFNQLLLAFPEQVSQAELESRVAAISPAAESLVPEFRARLSPMSRTGEPLTDDRAPVEWLTDRMILGYAAHGGELEQDLLPTAPGREPAEAGGRLLEGRPSRRLRARARELARGARGRARGRGGHRRARRPRRGRRAPPRSLGRADSARQPGARGRARALRAARRRRGSGSTST